MSGQDVERQTTATTARATRQEKPQQPIARHFMVWRCTTRHRHNENTRQQHTDTHTHARKHARRTPKRRDFFRITRRRYFAGAITLLRTKAPLGANVRPMYNRNSVDQKRFSCFEDSMCCAKAFGNQPPKHIQAPSTAGRDHRSTCIAISILNKSQ